MADHVYGVRPRLAVMTGYGARTGAVVMTVGIAAACWVVVVTQMRGMDMGVETGLGSFGYFVGVWAAMTAAMMLPGTAPAVGNFARTQKRAVAALPFAASYLGVWTLFGVASYAVYRPHGTVAAGIVTVAAGLYELTPLKRRARQRCREGARSGIHLGPHCLVSSAGLMLLLLAVGVMNIAWMSAIAAVVLVQKLTPPRKPVDATLALAIVALGAVILTSPSSVPGLVPAM